MQQLIEGGEAMKRLIAKAALATLLTGSAGGLALLAFLLAGAPGTVVRADPPVSIGVDLDPDGTPANEATLLGSIEGCVEVQDGDEFDIDIYIKDVSPDLKSFDLTFNYDSTLLEVWDVNVSPFLAAGDGSDVWEYCDPTPDTSGFFLVNAADMGSNHDSGEGVLARLHLKALDDKTGTSQADLMLITMKDGDDNNIEPTDQYGYYNGIVRNGMIAVNEPCPDADGDTIPDAADNCPNAKNPLQENGDGDQWGDVCDNCPTVYNDQADTDDDEVGDACDNCALVANGPNEAGIPGVGNQTDTDGDGLVDTDGDTLYNEDPLDSPPLARTDDDGDGKYDEDGGGGDACDSDDDADGYRDWAENHYGSDPRDASKTPEVCDGVDNDGDTDIDEDYDYNGNDVPDCTDWNANTDGLGEPNPNDLDDDEDGWLDTWENLAGTDSLDACPDDGNDPAWPVDIDNNTWVNMGDVLMFRYVVGGDMGEWNYDHRFDLNGNGHINMGDVLYFRSWVGKHC